MEVIVIGKGCFYKCGGDCRKCPVAKPTEA